MGTHRGHNDDAKLDVELTVLGSHSLRMTSCTVHHTSTSSPTAPQSYICSNVKQKVIVSYHSVPPQPVRKRSVIIVLFVLQL